MSREKALKLGEKRCPQCAEIVLGAARVCKHCGYTFSAVDGETYIASQKKMKQAAGVGCLVVLGLSLLVGKCAYDEGVRPMPSTAVGAKQGGATAIAKMLAEASAGAVVKERMKNPRSFDLVEANANPAKFDDGKPCWLVAVTYRGTNSFGGVVTSRALVWVDETGETPLKVVDVDGAR